ncbi:MAG TPA: glutathione peroxidase [Alphaproteobacteria bacterium]|nr:glutathione peroxidase [Alphaproteobacteria bacterium]
MTSLYDFSAPLIDGRQQAFSEYRGKVVLIANVASRCGFTPQYAGLEQLWRTYRDRGLVVLGFPCNQFGGQEPGSETEIAAFCRADYDITFPLFSKVDVNGAHAHPLYRWLKRRAPGRFLLRVIPWNFTKFLVARDGETVTRFGSATEPDRLVGPIEAALATADPIGERSPEKLAG